MNVDLNKIKYISLKEGKTAYIIDEPVFLQETPEKVDTKIDDDVGNVNNQEKETDKIVDKNKVDDSNDDTKKKKKKNDDNIDGILKKVDHELIVAVHGIGSYHFVWKNLVKHYMDVSNNVIEKLKNNDESQEVDVKEKIYSVLRLDLYGRGYSDDVHVNHTADLFIEQIKELLEKTGLVEKFKKITIVGHSMGGTVVLLFTHKYPELVKNVVALSPAGLDMGLNTVLSATRYIPNFLIRGAISISQRFFNPSSEMFIADNELLDERLKYISVPEHRNKFSSSFANSVKNFPLDRATKEIHELGSDKKFKDINFLIVWALYDTTVPTAHCFPVFRNAFKDHTSSIFVLLANTRHDFAYGGLSERGDVLHAIMDECLTKEGKVSIEELKKKFKYDDTVKLKDADRKTLEFAQKGFKDLIL